MIVFLVKGVGRDEGLTLGVFTTLSKARIAIRDNQVEWRLPGDGAKAGRRHTWTVEERHVTLRPEPFPRPAYYAEGAVRRRGWPS